MQIFLVFALLIAVLAVIFAIQNNAPATVAFALWEFQGSLALMLLVALIAGALISIFVSMPSNIRTRWTIRQQRKKMSELENNLSDLRTEVETAQKKLERLQMSETKPFSQPLQPTPLEEDTQDIKTESDKETEPADE